MGHEINPDNHYVEDESVTWEYTVEEDGSAKDIGGATLEWYLLPDKHSDTADAELDHTDSGIDVSLTSDGSDGRFDVTIDQDVTTDLAGYHWQRVIVDDTGSGKQIWGGPFPIATV